jgi:hypothetical protein
MPRDGTEEALSRVTHMKRCRSQSPLFDVYIGLDERDHRAVFAVSVGHSSDGLTRVADRRPANQP